MKKRSRITLSVSLALGIAVFCGGTAGAEDRISFGVSFPDSAEVIAATPSQSGFGDDANVSLAQTFTVTNAFAAQSIYLAYENDNNGNVDWDMTVTLFAVTNLQAATLVPEGSNLYSGTFTFPAVGGSDTIVRIDMAEPVYLEAGGYAVQINEASGADFNPGWEWLRPTSDVYAGGVMYEDGNIKSDGARDLCLAVDVKAPLMAVDDEYTLPIGLSSTNVAAPGVLANDVSYDSAVLVSNISSGSLTFNTDGSFECSGLANGYSTFSYAAVGGSVTSAPATVTLIATLSIDVPIAVDDAYEMDVSYANSYGGNVLNNDTNTSATLEMYAMLGDTNSLNGTVTMSSNGIFIYTPADGFVGSDTFTYMAYTDVATSGVATVTMTVEESGDLVIDSFENYDNSANVDVTAIPEALLNWDPAGSGQIEIRDGSSIGSNLQFMKFGWDSGRYRGAISTAALFSGIPDSSTEYWLYAELYPTSLTIDANFGVTTNSAHSVATAERGDFTAGVRFYGDGTNTSLYAFTGGGSSNDVLLTSGFTNNHWYGVWLNINNAENTYDVYVGDAGDPETLGALVGSDIAYKATIADLTSLLVSSTSTAYIDNILQLDFGGMSNPPASLYGMNPATNDTLQLSIGLSASAKATDYWPVSSDSLVPANWVPVAHSDTPDGTFAVTNLTVAGGEGTNKVIYVKATSDVEFFRIGNNQ